MLLFFYFGYIVVYLKEKKGMAKGWLKWEEIEKHWKIRIQL